MASETEQKHTPLPWRAVKNCGYINGSDGVAHYGPREVGVAIVGSYFDKELLPFNKERWDADVDIIIRSVNSHAGMLAALKALHADCEEYSRINNLHNEDGSPATNHAMRMAANAIAKAEAAS